MKKKIAKILIIIAAILGLLLAYYFLWFLRQPERQVPNDQSVFVSPANGKVVAVIEWDGAKLAWQKDNGVVQVMTSEIGQKGWLIAIEMDVTNVHYQRAPIKSHFISNNYVKGQFNNALIKTNDYGLRLENERNDMLFETENGLKYKVIQVAGLLARRIEDYVEPDQNVEQGEVIGLIKLGSQVGLVLPFDVEPIVKVGEVVTDGETVLAKVVND